RVPITNGTASAARADVAWHKVVRLLARVVVRAGGDVEEQLLESSFFDAATGVTIPEEIAPKLWHPEERSEPALRSASDEREGSAFDLAGADTPVASTRPIGDLIALGLTGLRPELEPKVTRLREDAQRRLQDEL